MSNKRTGHKEIRASKKPEPNTFAFLKKWWVITLEIITVISIFPFYDWLKQKSISTHDKYVNESQVTGTLNPPVIRNPKEYSISEFPPSFKISTSKKIGPNIKGILIKNFKRLSFVKITVGGMGFKCPTDDLTKGIKAYESVLNRCSNTTLDIGVKDNRLYVSVKFHALQDGALIGNIEFNHWTLYRKNMIDYKDDDERLEVKDNQGNIVFSVRYILNNENIGMVAISGYLLDGSNLIVLPNNNYGQDFVGLPCFIVTDQSKGDIQKEIAKITSVF